MLVLEFEFIKHQERKKQELEIIKMGFKANLCLGRRVSRLPRRQKEAKYQSRMYIFNRQKG